MFVWSTESSSVSLFVKYSDSERHHQGTHAIMLCSVMSTRLSDPISALSNLRNCREEQLAWCVSNSLHCWVQRRLTSTHHRSSKWTLRVSWTWEATKTDLYSRSAHNLNGLAWPPESWHLETLFLVFFAAVVIIRFLTVHFFLSPFLSYKIVW